jgi:hypothetical protein
MLLTPLVAHHGILDCAAALPSTVSAGIDVYWDCDLGLSLAKLHAASSAGA